MNIEIIATIAPIAILTISQIILLIKGYTKSAEKLQVEKEKYINKLLKKHKKTEEKFIKEEKKIQEVQKNAEKN